VSDTSDLYDDCPEGIVLRVHVQPGAGRSAVVGRHGDALKVRVAAPPVEGRANEATRALLAEALAVPEADVELTSGQSSRTKRFRLKGPRPRRPAAGPPADRPADRPGHMSRSRAPRW